MNHDRLCACADCHALRASKVSFASVDEALARYTALEIAWNTDDTASYSSEEATNIASWLYSRHIAIGFDENGNAIAQ